MKLVISCCLLVLDNEEELNIRKNTPKSIKIVLDKNNNLIKEEFDNKTNIKDLIRKKIINIIGSDKFHLEQVYTLGEKKYFYDNEINIIYLAITNIENIKNKLVDYELKKVDIINNQIIELGDKIITYHTEQKINSFGIEYFHIIDSDNINLEKNIMQILIAYKYLRSRIDNTDIIFKFLPNHFTLEDIRQVYEKISSKKVDKSNFRKKMINYCELVDEKINKGYRPTQLYKYKANEKDIWM